MPQSWNVPSVVGSVYAVALPMDAPLRRRGGDASVVPACSPRRHAGGDRLSLPVFLRWTTKIVRRYAVVVSTCIPASEAVMETLEATVWYERCAQRIIALDDQISDAEARRLAKDMHAFERTRAMAPEAAADFIASEMGRDDRSRFERRAIAR